MRIDELIFDAGVHRQSRYNVGAVLLVVAFTMPGRVGSETSLRTGPR